MAAVSEKELVRIIKSGEASGAYYIYGTDLYKTEALGRALCRAAVKKEDEVCNLHEFNGRELDVEGVCNACESYPVFAPKLCAAVRDLDIEEESKQHKDRKSLTAQRLSLLYDTVSDLPETTVLVFYTANVDVCAGKRYPTPKNKKLIDLIAKHGTVCEINVGTRSDNIKSVSSRVSKRGAAIDSRAAALLVDSCGSDINTLMNETDKLCAYAGTGVITEETVNMLTPDITGAKIYSLTDAIAAGNVSRALELYEKLISDPENTPILLLYSVTNSINDLYRARLAIDSGKSISDVARDFGIAKNMEFRIKNAFSSVRKTSTRKLRKCLCILSDADMSIKSQGSAYQSQILERAIVEMIYTEN